MGMRLTLVDSLYSKYQYAPFYFSLFLFSSQERSLENLPSLSPNIACQFVRLVECLMGIPPRIDCLKYICDHLLVSDLNDVKFVAAPSALETSVSAFEGQLVFI